MTTSTSIPPSAVRGNQRTAHPLRDDFSSLIGEVEKLVSHGGALTAEALEATRQRLAEEARVAKARLGELGDAASEKAEEARSMGEDYIRANPWKAVGIAAASGAVVGFLLGRR
ncbi:DUF883 family protein [Chitinimonas koreensis]|uniref:DUF883 family protein n=1 Tax=Chitinimonas koreensis TaxID=356302 RepID=UPI0003FE79A3|nr:DUF883 family protein [Chitinimonas koreensis]QNM95630.1 DUF883 domain-containing protein [Chitinimonas koreensis]